MGFIGIQAVIDMCLSTKQALIGVLIITDVYAKDITTTLVYAQLVWKNKNKNQE
jgi:hypothetical protein